MNTASGLLSGAARRSPSASNIPMPSEGARWDAPARITSSEIQPLRSDDGSTRALMQNSPGGRADIAAMWCVMICPQPTSATLMGCDCCSMLAMHRSRRARGKTVAVGRRLCSNRRTPSPSLRHEASLFRPPFLWRARVTDVIVRETLYFS